MLLNWQSARQFILKYKIVIIVTMLIIGLIAFFMVSHRPDDPSVMNRAHSDDSFTMLENNVNSTGENGSVKSKHKSNTNDPNAPIYVDIKGAVKYPNVYKMRSSDRIKQLLDQAKPTKDANLTNINLSEKLVDQKLIIIPNKDDVHQTALEEKDKLNVNNPNVVATNQLNRSTIKVNINTATEEELQTIPGIGPSKAKSIIEYRDSAGSFDSVEKLKEVNGIGDKTYEKLQDYLTVSR
ncbi:helix-hairpin-helix domain-containing protein [Staphylococcus sp. SQ8-PEA]|uniref:Helix-hairpin-helix domain-containing protein n=1 Tax=Staphylococcus marylandisciuri TaxID=2981529 RepID=A0ABT2QR01_9STAP|nr:helix-hairpin-helix domain-containing protein [Staphylococcus marylandisciuri]MCU5746407.1 helix-hairpin-helix domain-containing protein [Staphylococcus marylandisciuri]